MNFRDLTRDDSNFKSMSVNTGFEPLPEEDNRASTLHLIMRCLQINLNDL